MFRAVLLMWDVNGLNGALRGRSGGAQGGLFGGPPRPAHCTVESRADGFRAPLLNCPVDCFNCRRHIPGA